MVITEFKKLLRQVPNRYKVLVAADSPVFFKLAPSIDSRIYVVEGDVKHLDITNSENEDVWLKTFVDQYLHYECRKSYTDAYRQDV